MKILVITTPYDGVSMPLSIHNDKTNALTTTYWTEKKAKGLRSVVSQETVLEIV